MKKSGKEHYGTIIDNGQSPTNRIMVAIPMTGLLRAEWVMGRYGQVAPCNWSQQDFTVWLDQFSPLRYSVADARNLAVSQALESNSEWLFFLDHDVILPPGTLLRLNKYMLNADYPIVNGLYFTKCRPAEPLIYRGLGNSYFAKWKLGDKVMADGAGMGCTLIHNTILRAISAESEAYNVRGKVVPRVFVTPAAQAYDFDTKIASALMGTEDIEFYHKIKRLGIYKKAGWNKFQAMKYPLLVDTSIFCRHIDPSGMQYPAFGEEQEFMPKEARK